MATRSPLQLRALKTGVPFFLFLVGGSFALGHMRKYKYELADEQQRQLSAADTARKKPFSIEEEYQVYKRKAQLDEFRNIRVPRPGQSARQQQLLQIQQQQAPTPPELRQQQQQQQQQQQ